MSIGRMEFLTLARDRDMFIANGALAAWHTPIRYVLAWLPEEGGCLTIVENRAYSLHNFAKHGIGRFDSFEYAYASYVLMNASAPSDA